MCEGPSMTQTSALPPAQGPGSTRGRSVRESKAIPSIHDERGRSEAGQPAPQGTHLIPDFGWAEGLRKATVLVLLVKLKWKVVGREGWEVLVLTGASPLHGASRPQRRGEGGRDCCE